MKSLMKKLLVILALGCFSVPLLAQPMEPIEPNLPDPPASTECYVDGVICIPYWDGKQIIFLLYPNWVCP